MKHTAPKLALCALLALSAFTAQAMEGDPARGRTKAISCTACHGADGMKHAPNQPVIGGRPAEYLNAALNDFRTGKRFMPYMQLLLAGLSPQDQADVVAWFASQGTPVTAQAK